MQEDSLIKKLTIVCAILALTACGGSQTEDSTTVVDEVSEETATTIADALPQDEVEANALGDIAETPTAGMNGATEAVEAATEAVEAVRCTLLTTTASGGGSLTLNGAALTSDLVVKVGDAAATVVTATGPRMDLQLPTDVASGAVTVQRGSEDAVSCGDVTIE